MTNRTREPGPFESPQPPKTPGLFRDTGRLLLALVCLALAGCGGAAAKENARTEWRFAIEEPIGSVQHAYAKEFERLVEQRSGGEIDVVVYPYGTLGTSDQITEQLDMNVVHFAMASPGHLGKLIPEIQVLLLHFVFSDDEEVNNHVLNEDEELRAAFDELYARRNMKLLSMFSEGWQVWTTKEEVRTPEDFAGVKFRVMTSPLLIKAYEAYGASPTPLPYSEVYSGLQLNMIDGQENPVFAIQEMSFYEVTDWMIFAKHAPFVTTATCNREFHESLSEDRRELVDDVVEELTPFILERQRAYNRERLDLITARRPDLHVVPELAPEQRAAFRAESLATRDWFVEVTGESGRDVLEELLRAIERAESVPPPAQPLPAP